MLVELEILIQLVIFKSILIKHFLNAYLDLVKSML